jgi:hypothetical protein
MQRRVRQLRLELGSGGPHDAYFLCPQERLFEEPGLPDAGFSTHNERTAAALSRLQQQVSQYGEFSTVRLHGTSITAGQSYQR